MILFKGLNGYSFLLLSANRFGGAQRKREMVWRLAEEIVRRCMCHKCMSYSNETKILITDT